jgi:hypothetical protein
MHTPTKTLALCAAALFSMLLSACLKDNRTYPVLPPAALLMVVQGSADAPAESLYLNANQVNDPYQSFNYGDHLGYFRAYTGKRTATFYNYIIPGTLPPSIKYASDTLTLVANTAYSLFMANTYKSPDFLLLTDSIAMPATGMVAIRLVNVSPDAGAVDLVLNNATTLVSNVAYKGATTFLPVAGNKSYDFSFRSHTSGTVIAQLNNIPVNAGSEYTVWLHGMAAGTGTIALKGDIILNANY